MKVRLQIAILFLFGLTACRNSTETATPEPTRGTVRSKGDFAGAPVQKTIGPEGGTLTSPDNQLTLIIPAGAVPAPVAFSVTPVVNTLPGSPGNSYRLLPEGTPFAKPVTIRYTYSAGALDSTSADALYLAYQSNDGIWQFLPGTKLDAAARTLTVETTHFSDWAPFAAFWLEGANKRIKPGASAKLTIMSPFFLTDLTGKQQALEIADVRPLETASNIRNWKATYDKLTVESGNVSAIYQAPAQVPASGLTVGISVEVTNFIPKGYQERPGASGKAVLLGTILVNGETYFSATVDGQLFNGTFAGFTRADEGLVLTGNIGTNENVTITLYDHPTAGNKSYSFYSGGGEDTEAGKAVAVLIWGAKKEGWVSYYGDCNGAYHASPGKLQLTHVETVGGKTYLTGKLEAVVYKEIPGTPCPTIQQKTITVEFRIPPIG